MTFCTFLEQLKKLNNYDLKEFEKIYFAQSNQPPHIYWSSPKYV